MLKEVNLRKSLEFAVTTEDLGAKFYSELSNKFVDKPEIKELFATLARDEVVHKKQFTGLLENLSEEKISTNEDNIRYLQAMATSENFSTENGPFKEVDKIKSKEEALAKSFELEKATLGYYQAIKEILGENDSLNAIINAEKKHVVNLMKVMVSDGKLRSLEDTW
jgi:rubrerythrin